jgi:hypothetical protein
LYDHHQAIEEIEDDDEGTVDDTEANFNWNESLSFRVDKFEKLYQTPLVLKFYMEQLGNLNN